MAVLPAAYRVFPGIALISVAFISWFHFADFTSFLTVSQAPKDVSRPNNKWLWKKNASSSSLPSAPPLLPYKRIMWADVDSSGGASLRPILRVYCEGSKGKNNHECAQVSDTMLSNRTVGFLHDKTLRPRKAIIKETDAYLYTLRHPVERMLSSYHSENPGSCRKSRSAKLACRTAKDIAANPNGTAAFFYQTCFPMQELLPLAFSRAGLSFLKNRACAELARNAIEGRIEEKGFQSMRYNTIYYANRTIIQYPSKAALVIRTEFLWDDLTDLDLRLGGDGLLGSIEGTTIGAHKNPLGNGTNQGALPTAGYRLLCCAMQEEMHIYRRLLDRAVNLDEASKVSTINSSAQQCGFASWNDMVDQCNQQFFGMYQISHGHLPTSMLPASPPLAFNNILFAHVGKAGGNSLRVLFQRYCESERHTIDAGCYESPDSMLSDQTKGFFHSTFMRPKFGAVDAADAYLYNLRHPVDRMLSWYNYEHPQSCLHNTATRIACHTAERIKVDPKNETALFFQTCFPSQLSLPLAFNNTDSGSVLQRTCAKLLRKVFAGKMIDRPSGESFKPIQGFKHISYNIRYYKRRTLDRHPKRKVLVLRTESLWDDLKDLDVQLGGYGTFGQREGYKDSHGSEVYRKKKDTLSAADFSVLCCALLDEMNVYRDLLRRAVNFDEATKKATLANVAQKCSFASWKEMVHQCSRRQGVVFGSKQIKKIDSTTSLVPKSPILPVTNITFVHAGKTGSGALHILLKQFCETHRDSFPIRKCPAAPDCLLANQITGYVYGDRVKPSKEVVSMSSAFFYTLRHPVDHFIDWYNYEHPGNCIDGHEYRLSCLTAKEVAANGQGEAALFFRECFPTLDLLLSSFGRPATNRSIGSDCHELAQNVIDGHVYGPGFQHISHNIRSYVNQTIDHFQDKAVLVVRGGHLLWDDLKDLDFQLGGTGYFGQVEEEQQRRAHDDDDNDESNIVFSKVESGLLCCAMMDELHSYHRLIELAVNLDDDAKEDTIRAASERCGFSSWDELVNSCAGH